MEHLQASDGRAPSDRANRRVANFCGACGEDFNALTAFDAHRVGKHAYRFSITDSARHDGRRCLAPIELTELGWSLDSKGRWRLPASDRNLGLGEHAGRLTQARDRQSPSPALEALEIEVAS